MLKTKLIGIGLLVIGLVTAVKYGSESDVGNSMGMFLGFVGAFLIWNAFVANYNSDPSFAIFD